MTVKYHKYNGKRYNRYKGRLHLGSAAEHFSFIDFSFAYCDHEVAPTLYSLLLIILTLNLFRSASEMPSLGTYRVQFVPDDFDVEFKETGFRAALGKDYLHTICS